MKKLFLSLTCFIAVTTSYGQLNCDTLCSQSAALNSFKVLNNSSEEGSEVINGGQNDAIMNCEILCEIEAKRKQYDDIIIKFQGLVILVYSEEKVSVNIENE